MTASANVSPVFPAGVFVGWRVFQIKAQLQTRGIIVHAVLGSISSSGKVLVPPELITYRHDWHAAHRASCPACRCQCMERNCCPPPSRGWQPRKRQHEPSPQRPRAAMRLLSSGGRWVSPCLREMAQRGHRAHSSHKDKQTGVPSWGQRPKTLGDESHAELGILQNLSRMQTAVLVCPRTGRDNIFLTGQKRCSTRIKPNSRKRGACLPRTPLSSTGGHGPRHPHLSSGRHGGDGQRHGSRDVRSHFWNSAKTRGIVSARKAPKNKQESGPGAPKRHLGGEPKGPGAGAARPDITDLTQVSPSPVWALPLSSGQGSPGSAPVFHNHSSGG